MRTSKSSELKNSSKSVFGISDTFVTYTEFVSADGLVKAPEKGRKKLLKDLESGNVFEHCKDDEHESLQAIADISQHFYSTVEDSRFTKWLRENEFDGCFTREGTSEPMEENAFIFNPENIEIIENQI